MNDNIRDEFGQKVQLNLIEDAIWGQDKFINALKHRNLNTFDKIKNKFGNTFMNNMDKLVTRRKKLVKEINDTPNDIEKLKQEKVNKNKANKENIFFKKLDKKAMNNMEKVANTQQQLKEKEEELERTETAQKELDKRRKELRQKTLALTAKGKLEFGTSNWFFNGNHENTDLYKLKIIIQKEADIALKKQGDIYETIKRLKSDVRSLKTKIAKGPKLTKEFILYSVQDMLDDRGIKGKDSRPFILKLDKDSKAVRENKYQMFKYMVAAQLFNIPYFLYELKEKEEIPEYRNDIINTPEKIEKILRSGLAMPVKKYLGVQLVPYSIAKRGDVQKILDMNIPDKWKVLIIDYQLLQMYRVFASESNINLVKELVKTWNVQNVHKEIKKQENMFILQKRVKALKPLIRKKKNAENLKKLNNGKVTNLTPERIEKAIDSLNNQITKKTKNVAKLRKDYENANNSPNKLELIKKEINRRNKEISDLVKKSNKYKNYTKAAAKIGAGARGRITRKYTNLLKAQKKAENQVEKARQNIQNLKNVRAGGKNKVDNRKRLAEQKKVINRFIGKLAQNTRTTTKHKYKILTRLMEPNAAVDFAGETGLATELARVLGEKGLVCHLGGKNANYVKTYIPQLRESLYALSVQYLNQYNAKKTAEEKKEFHKKFLNKVVNKAAYPCLEGTFTGITNAIANEGFEWNGQKGWKKNHPYILNRQNHLNLLRDVLFTKAIGSYYGTLNNKGKKKFQGESRKDQMLKIWGKIKEKELAHGEFITALEEIPNNNGGQKVRKAYVDAFKNTANYLYENNKVYTNAELNAEEAEMNKLNKNDLID